MKISNVPFLLPLGIIACACAVAALGQTPSPVESRGATGFAVSSPVRQIAGTDGMSTSPPQRISLLNGSEPTRSGSLDTRVEAPDPGGGSTRARKGLFLPSVLPTPTATFEGISVFDTVPLGQGFLPPDTSGEAGPNHFVQAVNAAFRVWDRQGNALTPMISLGSLFGSLSGPCQASISGYPNVLYDQLADRWLISERCNVAPGHQLVAVSVTNDPTGSYYLYDFQVPHTYHMWRVDAPRIGVWPDGYYMTDHQRSSDDIEFRGAGFFAFDRLKMLAGDPTATYVYFNSCPETWNCTVIGADPSDVDGFIPPPDGTPNIVALYTAVYYNDPQGDGLRLFDFHADFAHPENSTFTERPESPVVVAAFSPGVDWLPQPGISYPNAFLDPQSVRLMRRLAYRRFANGRETLVTNHAVDAGAPLAGGHAGVRYYELDKTPGQPFSIAEQQTFAPPDDASRWMASGAMNFLGDTAVGYSITSKTIHPSVRYAARLATDPPGTGLAQGEQSIVVGNGTQFSSTRRWGDFSDLTVDPIDDCTFWYTQEYYPTSNTNGWHTIISKFAPRPCSVSPRATISGTVRSCSSGTPIQGIPVEASGGFERVTDGNGRFQMTVSPGSYTLTPKREGYVLGSPANVTVNDGDSPDLSFCMTSVPSVKTNGGPTVTTGNGYVDPNECNGLTIPLRNDGSVTATNVHATLTTTTPGVTISQSFSSYPSIAPGSSQNNSASFQISTAPSVACLSTIDLKLSTTYDGATAPVEKQMQIQVGKPTGADYVFTASTGQISNTAAMIPQSNTFPAPIITIPVPFEFSVYGRHVPMGALLKPGYFGTVEITDNPPLGPPDTMGNGVDQPLPSTMMEAQIAYLAPYWDQLEMRNDEAITGSGIFTELTGTAPNRTFMIEWRARHTRLDIGGPANIDFAVLFHENSDSFDYVYKLTDDLAAVQNGATASVGVQASNALDHYTQYSYHQAVITPGLKLTAKRPDPVCAAGTGVCPLGTTASLVSVSGGVLDSHGSGLRGVTVVLNENGSIRTAITNAFGFYSFDNVNTGRSYVLGATAKRYMFSPRVLSVNDTLADVNLVALY